MRDKRRVSNDIDGESESNGGLTFSLWKILLIVVEVANHVMIFLVTAYVLYLAGEKLTTTNVHAGLCTVGYVLLMSEGIAVLASDSLLTRLLTRRVASHIHWVLQCVGAALSFAGFALIYRVKESHHFKSIHAILGFSSIVIMCVLGFSGIPVIFATSLRNRIRPVTSKLCHNLLGISCFVLGMISQCYGYQKGWMTKSAGQEIATLCTVFTGLILILSIIGALRSLRGQIGSILS